MHTDIFVVPGMIAVLLKSAFPSVPIPKTYCVMSQKCPGANISLRTWTKSAWRPSWPIAPTVFGVGGPTWQKSAELLTVGPILVAMSVAHVTMAEERHHQTAIIVWVQ